MNNIFILIVCELIGCRSLSHSALNQKNRTEDGPHAAEKFLDESSFSGRHPCLDESESYIINDELEQSIKGLDSSKFSLRESASRKIRELLFYSNENGNIGKGISLWLSEKTASAEVHSRLSMIKTSCLEFAAKDLAECSDLDSIVATSSDSYFIMTANPDFFAQLTKTILSEGLSCREAATEFSKEFESYKIAMASIYTKLIPNSEGIKLTILPRVESVLRPERCCKTKDFMASLKPNAFIAGLTLKEPDELKQAKLLCLSMDHMFIESLTYDENGKEIEYSYDRLGDEIFIATKIQNGTENFVVGHCFKKDAKILGL